MTNEKDSNNYYDDYEYHYDGDVLIGYALLCIPALYQLLLLPKLPDVRTFLALVLQSQPC